MTKTEKLIQEITKHGVTTLGNEAMNSEGVKYRYDHTILKYKHAAKWLANLFKEAASENGPNYASHFFYGDYSISFDRAKFKGQPDRKISFSKLVLL